MFTADCGNVYILYRTKGTTLILTLMPGWCPLDNKISFAKERSAKDQERIYLSFVLTFVAE